MKLSDGRRFSNGVKPYYESLERPLAAIVRARNVLGGGAGVDSGGEGGSQQPAHRTRDHQLFVRPNNSHGDPAIIR